MAGTIVADTLTHSTAGSLTTDYVVDGTPRAWVRFSNADDAIDASLGVSSLTDNSSGQTYVNFTTSFTSSTAFVALGTNNAWHNYVASHTASQVQVISGNSAHNQADASAVNCLATGDLA